jgi:hypothetical protein
MPWNIFHLTTQDSNYGLCAELSPWTPVARGEVLRLVCELTDGAEFVSCDPKKRGEFVLEGTGKKIWVWQNRKAWTNHPGNSCTLQGVPKNATRLSVYGWDGLRRTIELSGEARVNVDQLAPGETYMFVATSR